MRTPGQAVTQPALAVYNAARGTPSQKGLANAVNTRVLVVYSFPIAALRNCHSGWQTQMYSLTILEVRVWSPSPWARVRVVSSGLLASERPEGRICFLAFFSSQGLAACAPWLGAHPASSKPISPVSASLISWPSPLSDPPASLLWERCDYIRSSRIVQNNLPASQSLTNHICKVPFVI